MSKREFEGGEKLFKQVPMKIVVPIIVITWILSIVSALAIASSGLMSLGAVGPAGPKGDTGPAGPTGPQGEQGPAGPAGATGPAGSAGPAGAAGPAGPAGAAGANGATWWNGTGTPASSLGSNGDFYLDLSNSDVYNKISGSWTKVANIQGATGATGPQGPQGPAGVTVVKSSKSAGSISVTSTPVSILSVSITAPADGSVLLLATGDAHYSADKVWVYYGLGTTSGSTDLGRTIAGDAYGSGTSYWYDSLTVQAVVSVVSGNTYYFYATIYKDSTLTTMPDVYFYDAYLSAIFFAT